MKRVIRYQTADGQLHASEQAAVRHAERRYGCALTKLAHQACRIDKYIAMGEFIEENLDNFQDLARLREDIALENPAEEDND